MIYFIADTHFGHFNIIKYCNRPFENAEEMDKVLIEKWNNKVKKEDTVYHLGDFSFNKNPRDYLRQLNGKITLIKGNHDKRKTLKAFDEVFVLTTIDVDNKPVILCHYPIYEWERKQRGSIHLYGHVHDKPKTWLNSENAHCVSVECIDYTPKTLEQIIGG